jgi:glycosyltransferase involved in cell wall biosynthesis
MPDDAPQSENEKNIRLSFVVPVFNEAEAVSAFVNSVKAVFGELDTLSLEIIFVNDGSHDDTLIRLLELQKQFSEICIVDLSRNFGKEAALTAGLDRSSGNVVVPIDVDLQDPPELVLQMIEKWREGYDVVFAKRVNRTADKWAKKTSAKLFYRLINKISEHKSPENVGDFRLMDRSVVEALRTLPESKRFMKGLFAWVGFRSVAVEYTRTERVAGTTKFNGWRLWNLALDGITSFSIVPLRIWTYLGGLVASISFLYAIFLILKVVISGTDVPGYASLMVAVTFFGGLQLIGIGVIGEYLGRSYIESKRRPIYLVRKVYKTQRSHFE